VLHRTVLVRQLEEAASTDSKTGLLNAAAWHVQASREILRDERAERASTVFVLDLDHFKRINDEHGHLVGDQVLAAVAGAVRAEVRDGDVVGRFGGEEFVVLLRSVDDADGGSDPRSAALAVAERIRARVAGLRVAVAGSSGSTQVDGLTVSIGGATRPVDGRELPRLLEVADAAMYDAKRAGRNCVRMGRSAYEAEDLRRI
jgi:diguanylate cyclase (GGDEF)-like protein